MKENLKIFNDPQETANAFGDYLIAQISASDSFHCALSGGSTPKLLFQYLATHYSDFTQWEKLHVYWGDERCVPPSDEESNFKMTNDLLLSKVGIPKENIHRVRGEENPEQEAHRYGEELASSLPAENGWPMFDLIILGMGDDGHTASIFPHQMELLTEEKVAAVATHPTSGQQRVTLTGPIINNATEIVFLVTGEGKREKVVEVVKQQGAWESYPASHIEPTRGKLLWFLDQGAARDIT